MADEDKTAEALAGETTVPPNDGFVDLDFVTTETESDDEKQEEEGKIEDAKEDGEKERPKKLPGSKREKIKNELLLNENRELQRRLEEAERRAPKGDGEAASDEKAPREEDFNGDWFAWQRALSAFDAGKAAQTAIRNEFKSLEDKVQSGKQSEIAQERTAAHIERVEDARETITDFDEVMAGMKGVDVRRDVLDEIMSSEKSALIAYHLAKNPQKLREMDAMSTRELAREIGRLEGSVRMPAAKKQTSAPVPLSSVKGGASPSSPEKDLEAWLKKKYG